MKNLSGDSTSGYLQNDLGESCGIRRTNDIGICFGVGDMKLCTYSRAVIFNLCAKAGTLVSHEMIKVENCCSSMVVIVFENGMIHRHTKKGKLIGLANLA